LTDTLPPHPDRWSRYVLRWAPGADGYEGAIYGPDGAVYMHIRNGVKLATGGIGMECQHAADAEVEAMFEALTAGVGG
jgi:hypothetical protein